MTRRRFIAPLTAAAAAAAAVSAFALPATAHAAPVPRAAAACGWQAPFGAESGTNTFPGLEYWLSWDTCNNTVRGAMIISSGVRDYHLWVYNDVTGDSSAIASVKHDQNIYTPRAISDSPVRSTRVCVQPIVPSTGAPIADKKCTAYH